MNRRAFFRRTLGALAAAVAAPYLPTCRCGKHVVFFASSISAEEFAARVIRPAALQLANDIDRRVFDDVYGAVLAADIS